MHRIFAAALPVLLVVANASANVYITEFCSDTGNGEHFEFAEFTNLGSTPVDMTGWSEDDSSAKPNKAGHILTGLGKLAPGESGILTEADPLAFRAYWGAANLPATVPVVGGYSNDNLGTGTDSVTLFDSTGTLVDRIDYSTGTGGSGDTVGRNCPIAFLGKNQNSAWVDSTIGDVFGSFRSVQDNGVIADPGRYPIPEPTSLTLIGAVGVLAARRRMR